ncbi:Acyl-CoA N-acyltransferase [Penicillium paradoxum]|uniref:Acyl-CoA N-acyltransferase n=1 Tax=Penicillium paradoxum TaxID=176176 RepID=UPI00254839E4|nr:Acyl-CoA N-acyltransferase [Penicillium paradoxum]KAJ5780702.1 Acyl-CoA N-acyltransferase [Penicillium paradoxum]
MASEICIYEHDPDTILPTLVSELPYSTSLLRRIQHGIAYPFKTARILSTFPPGLTPDSRQPWLAARVDLFRGRETQIFLYSSLEAEHTSNQPIAPVSDSLGANPGSQTLVDTTSNNNTNDSQHPTISLICTLVASQPVQDLARAQLLALLSYVKINLLPPYLSSLAKLPEATSIAGNRLLPSIPGKRDVPLIPAPDPQAFLIGSLHTGLFSLLQRSGAYTASDPVPNIRVHRFDDPPYLKYFFRRSHFSPEEESGKFVDHPSVDLSLPPGYRFHDRAGREGVLDEHLDLVQSRTHIPRSRSQLSMMPGMAVYVNDPGDSDEMPIAWGFLGLDGALATLHVEPEHRGRGLAVPLSKAIMRRGMAVDGVFGAGSVNVEDSQARERVGNWAHTDVANYNKASRRVMEKIGGQVLTTVTWAVLELLD